MVDQELELGVRSVAAPIRDAGGRVVAAMNASGHASRVTLAQMKRQFLPGLLEAVRNVSTTLALRRT